MNKSFKILFFVLIFFAFGKVFAQSDIEAELEAKQKAKAALEAELREDQKKLDAVSAQKNTLNRAVTELDLTGKKLGTEVKLTQSKINETESTIQNLNLTIVEKENRIHTFQDTIGVGIQSLHDFDNEPFIISVLAKGSITEAMKEADERRNLNRSMGQAIHELFTEKELLALDKKDREEKKEKLLDYKGEVLVQKTEVDKNKSDKTVLLNQTKAEEENYKKIIAEKQKLQAQFESDLAALEAKLEFNLDPDSYPKAKHGILAWPTEHVLVTQGFGLTESSYKLYQYRTGAWKGKHAGVDLRANSDRVMAMADGVVLGAGNTDTVCPKASTGIWVLIKHDNGLASTYFHLSQTLVKAGQRVKTGDLIAYSGNTGYSTAPHLHIGVMPAGVVSIQTWASAGCPGKNYTTPVVANSFYLNPLDYLPKATDDMFKSGNSD